MQTLEHDRRPAGEEPEQPVIADLVADGCSDASSLRELPVTERPALLGHAEERRTQTASADELVDSLLAEQVPDLLRQVDRLCHQGGAAPVVLAELVDG